MGNNPISNHVFHDDISTINTGTDYRVTGRENIAVLQFITDEGTTFTANILCKCVDNDNWYTCPFVKNSDLSIITSGQINDEGSLYSVDLTGITSLRVDVVDVDGTLSVFGRMVG